MPEVENVNLLPFLNDAIVNPDGVVEHLKHSRFSCEPVRLTVETKLTSSHGLTDRSRISVPQKGCLPE